MAFHGETRPEPVSVAARERRRLPPIEIAGRTIDQALPPIRYDDLRSAKHFGAVVSLKDHQFVRGFYSLGLRKPQDFIARVRPGIFLLGPYRSDQTPVLLIHGMEGGPLDWGTVAEALRASALQPMVAYYPTGVSLPIVVDYLTNGLVQMQRRLGFERVHIMAHSMGGLVARALAQRLTEGHQAVGIASLTTIDSPLGGLQSAESGVRHALIVIPSWRDLAPGSAFLAGLEAWEQPASLPYNLILGYLQGKGSDGTVPLQSQIPLWLQRDATTMRGFVGNHVAKTGDGPQFRDPCRQRVLGRLTKEADGFGVSFQCPALETSVFGEAELSLPVQP